MTGEDGGLCSRSEQTMRVTGEDGGLCSSSEQTRIMAGEDSEWAVFQY